MESDLINARTTCVSMICLLTSLVFPWACCVSGSCEFMILLAACNADVCIHIIYLNLGRPRARLSLNSFISAC